jgi:AcrR family transcriptional regulator
MKFSDEILTAYADGELAEPVRSQVERAMRADPALAARVAQHKAMRTRISHVFANIVNEAIPPRPQPGSGSGKVVQLNAVRAARQQQQQQQQQQARERPRWSWRQGVAIAAALLVGVAAGVLGLRALDDSGRILAVSNKDGALLAQGTLATALSKQLASAGPAGSRVRIGASFLAKDGSYCRSFAIGATAGLACMAGGQWRVPVLEEGSAGEPESYRQATTEIPSAVLGAIDLRIDGAALNADDERAARERGWKR